MQVQVQESRLALSAANPSRAANLLGFAALTPAYVE
jgi:hypothetical protein